MKINESIILNMVTPHVAANTLSYDTFDRLFRMLPHAEQYKVADFLSAQGIELVDTVELPLAAGAEGQPLYDNRIFGGNDPVDFTSVLRRKAALSNEMLAKLAHEGNQEALGELWVKNQKLVMKYANQYTGMYGNKLTTDDLISAGNIGFMKAVRRFDYSLGNAFSTYAVWWIRQAIFREIADNGYTIRIPVHMHEKIRKVLKLENELIRRRMARRCDRITEIVRLLKDTNTPMNEEQVIECMQLGLQMNMASLDMPVREDSDAVLGDFIPAPEQDNPENQLVRIALKDDLDKVMENLTSRERDVIFARFGLDGFGQRTLEEVGKEMHVTRERVRQIEAKAMRRLKMFATKAHLDDYMADFAQ